MGCQKQKNLLFFFKYAPESPVTIKAGNSETPVYAHYLLFACRSQQHQLFLRVTEPKNGVKTMQTRCGFTFFFSVKFILINFRRTTFSFAIKSGAKLTKPI